MKVILIGFMGAGKSTVAAELAERLSLPVIEMDSIIIARSGLRSIPDIFEQKGEATFRDLESEVAREVGSVTSGVVSTGGGIVGREENMLELESNGAIVIYLRTSFETVVARIGHPGKRPLFREPARARKLFEVRHPLYLKWADHVVDTDKCSPEGVCSSIISKISSPV